MKLLNLIIEGGLQPNLQARLQPTDTPQPDLIFKRYSLYDTSFLRPAPPIYF
jgi:hypothetical protein